MESIHVRELALSDPLAFLEKYPDGAILFVDSFKLVH
jgi:hypothetical protein